MNKTEIKVLRLKRKLTQKQLAELIGVSYNAVSCWELGKRKPPVTKFSAIAKALKVSETKIFECFK